MDHLLGTVLCYILLGPYKRYQSQNLPSPSLQEILYLRLVETAAAPVARDKDLKVKFLISFTLPSMGSATKIRSDSLEERKNEPVPPSRH